MDLVLFGERHGKTVGDGVCVSGVVVGVEFERRVERQVNKVT